MWEDFDLDQAWKIYKRGINETGFILQYPTELAKVIDFLEEKLIKYNDHQIAEQEIVAFKENLGLPNLEDCRSADTAFLYRVKWDHFCVTMGKFFSKCSGLGMFKVRTYKEDLGRTISLRQSLKNLKSPGAVSDPMSSDEPMSG